MKKTNLVIFASGSGTNAVNIIKYFENDKNIEIKLLVCNKWNAPVIQKTIDLGIKVFICNNEDIEKADYLKNILCENKIDGIVLAGFLRKIPDDLINEFENKIINIHPSLLPKYGGKGMYGSLVHKAVLQNEEKYSGITIHVVDNKYDNGKILFQEKIEIKKNETLSTLQEKIHNLEMEFFPQVIEKHFMPI